ncbi:beta-N-acetylhexosaminidase [Membranihabitans maritimus]|uniref:beta-N-acetylhexosaminidase n=1 Tax=Membranihabitans maritimus TaxID=2904244 RepID=UPI001F01D5C1|nr:family 20 glycosylhydrolase [Membranihabitans maritimus]
MEQNYFNSFLFFLTLTCIFTSCRSEIKQLPIAIIPEPAKIEHREQTPFVIEDHSLIYISDSSMLFPAEELLGLLDDDYEIQWIDSGLIMNSGISFNWSTPLDTLPLEGYEIDVHNSHISIFAKSSPGFLYAVESLRQILPNDEEELSQSALPSGTITDYPRFSWRGMHLDVSRHFMPVSFIKKYIDFLRYHKLNTFHWHLVDGIGWRIEIKSHPELTELGAWRVVKEGNKPWENFEIWREGDPRPKYGGYYTQEEIKEIVTYAQQRGVTIIPEIELPGHSEVVMQCYPGLLCVNASGQKLENIGVYCANNQESYSLLEDILEEVLALFPSEYIHIGGDEVSKRNWNNCVRCKSLMRNNNLNAEGVQSYFVNYFDRFLRDRGRKLIGWHEIVEGQLSREASLMYWGGINSVEDYFEKGHPMVLTTGSRYYFDHYQSESKQEPIAFGGLSTLTQVYNYEPFPLAWKDKFGNQMLGIQANVWTEYMKSPEHVEYMVMPRMAALAETAWTQPQKKDWDRFSQRIPPLMDFYKSKNINYSKSAYRPMIEVSVTDTKELFASISTELSADIYFTRGNKNPDLQSNKYSTPFHVDSSILINAISSRKNEILVKPERKQVRVHKALGQKTFLESSPYGNYKGNGGSTLVDGRFGGNNWGNGKWLGILSKDFSATIEFDTIQDVREIGYSAIEDRGSGIYFPKNIEIFVTTDGTDFQEVLNYELNDTVDYNQKSKDSIFKITFPPIKTHKVKVISRYPRIPDKGVFLFVDELMIN